MVPGSGCSAAQAAVPCEVAGWPRSAPLLYLACFAQGNCAFLSSFSFLCGHSLDCYTLLFIVPSFVHRVASLEPTPHRTNSSRCHDFSRVRLDCLHASCACLWFCLCRFGGRRSRGHQSHDDGQSDASCRHRGPAFRTRWGWWGRQPLLPSRPVPPHTSVARGCE